MQVVKWENSLAVRLPDSIVETLGLREGDEIEIEMAGERKLLVSRDRSREQVLARLKALQRPLPPGFRFSRDDANER
jgi:antitoxin MazE